MILFTNHISGRDLSNEIIKFGLINYPEKIPKYDGSNNIFVYNRKLTKAINELYPLYLIDKGYNFVIPFNI